MNHQRKVKNQKRAGQAKLNEHYFKLTHVSKRKTVQKMNQIVVVVVVSVVTVVRGAIAVILYKCCLVQRNARTKLHYCICCQLIGVCLSAPPPVCAMEVFFFFPICIYINQSLNLISPAGMQPAHEDL